jgi:TRAP-type C4-dicarboxylate transport system permease large subunit
VLADKFSQSLLQKQLRLSMARDVPMIETFKGVIPFFCSDIVRVAILIAAPVITLILPRLLA